MMNDSRDSRLFDNEDLNFGQRQQGEVDPFARALPASDEPLFPATLPVETIPDSAPDPLADFSSAPYSARYDVRGYDSFPSGMAQPKTVQEFDAEPSPSTCGMELATSPVTPFTMPTSAVPPSKHKHGPTEKEINYDRDFAVFMNLMQHGAWPQVLEKLQAMRVEYPYAGALDGLIDEATLKAELMAEWTHKPFVALPVVACALCKRDDLLSEFRRSLA
jgi:hypothetical protein